MHPLDEAPAFPRGEQARNGVCQAVFESRHDDAACRAGHTLHIAQNKRSSDAVGLAGASPCDYNGGVRADKLRKSLGLVKVNFLVGHVGKICKFAEIKNINYGLDNYTRSNFRFCRRFCISTSAQKAQCLDKRLYCNSNRWCSRIDYPIGLWTYQ